MLNQNTNQVNSAPVSSLVVHSRRETGAEMKRRLHNEEVKKSYNEIKSSLLNGSRKVEIEQAIRNSKKSIPLDHHHDLINLDDHLNNGGCCPNFKSSFPIVAVLDDVKNKLNEDIRNNDPGLCNAIPQGARFSLFHSVSFPYTTNFDPTRKSYLTVDLNLDFSPSPKCTIV